MLVAIVAIVAMVAVSGGCLAPTRVLRFRLPTLADSHFQAIPLNRTTTRLTTYVSTELVGLTAERVRDTLLGPPHELQAAPGSGEIWLYTFVRMPAGYQMHHDARYIGRFSAEYPNLRLALVIVDNKVETAQVAWFEEVPAFAFQVERLLGRPDRRETTQGDERFHYRYECFTAHRRVSGAITYTLTDAVLTVPFTAEGNAQGLDLLIADQTKLTVFPDGRTEDPSTGVTWVMRPKLSGGLSVAQTPVDLICTELKQLNTPGRVQATFGWPTDTIAAETAGVPMTFAIYPLQRRRASPGHLVVSYMQSGSTTTVKSLGLHFKGGLPRDPADLRLRLGTPDRVVGAPAGGFENWVYEYRIAAPPPVTGTPSRLVFGLRLTFQIRNGVELLPSVDVERTSLTTTTTATGRRDRSDTAAFADR